MQNLFRARPISRRRAAVLLLAAAALDGLQVALGPLGWFLLDEILDVVGVIVFSLLMGFHPLLLPTFVVEVIPVVDMLPTWTACVGAVLVLRRKLGRESAAPVVKSPNSNPPPPPNSGPTVDV
jgi:hypothetical protein